MSLFTCMLHHEVYSWEWNVTNIICVALLAYFHFLVNSSCVWSGLAHKFIATPNNFVYIYCFTCRGADMVTVCKTTVNWQEMSKKNGDDIVGIYIQCLCNGFSLNYKLRFPGFCCFRPCCFIWFHAFLICIALAKECHGMQKVLLNASFHVQARI